MLHNATLAKTNPIINIITEIHNITSTCSCLSISSMLLSKNKRQESNLRAVYKKTLEFCDEYYFKYPDKNVFEIKVPRTRQNISIVQLLKWIIGNSCQIQLQGVTNIILDTLHDARLHELLQIVNLLKKLRSVGFKINIFNEDGHLIEVEEIDDVMRFDDYLNIIIISLMDKKHFYQNIYLKKTYMDASQKASF